MTYFLHFFLTIPGILVTMLKDLKTALFQTFSTWHRILSALLPYTDLVPPSTDPVPTSTNQYPPILFLLEDYRLLHSLPWVLFEIGFVWSGQTNYKFILTRLSICSMIVSFKLLPCPIILFFQLLVETETVNHPFFAPFEARIASIRPQKGIFCLPANNPFSVKGFLIYAFLATFSLSQISQRASIQVLAAVARNKGLASLPTRLHQVENISGDSLMVVFCF